MFNIIDTTPFLIQVWALINCASISFSIIWKNKHDFCAFSKSSTASIIGIFFIYGREHWQSHDLFDHYICKL